MAEEKKTDIVSWSHSRIPALQSFGSFMRFLLEKRIAVLLILVGIFLLILFWRYIQMAVVMGLFIALAAVSMLYNRWVKISIGVEFVLLGLVITTIIYGTVPGIFVGIVGLFLAEILSERFTYSTFVSFIGIVVVALATNTIYGLTNNHITMTGILLTLLYNAIIIPGYLLLGSSVGRSMLFAVTHIIFNIWVFSFLAPLIIRILT
jgi:hypothetical protein